jgi:type I restriction enzyme M protein
MYLYANKILLEDELDYLTIDESSEDGREYLDAVREEALEQLGYFLKPSELFSEIAKRGASKSAEGEVNGVDFREELTRDFH